MTAVDSAFDELKTRLDEVAPEFEGLQDFTRLNIKESTLTEVRALVDQYRRRITLMTEANRALANLIQDGYPEMAAREVPQEVIDELADNARTIEAALKRFSSGSATGMELTAGAAQPKA